MANTYLDSDIESLSHDSISKKINNPDTSDSMSLSKLYEITNKFTKFDCVKDLRVEGCVHDIYNNTFFLVDTNFYGKIIKIKMCYNNDSQQDNKITEGDKIVVQVSYNNKRKFLETNKIHILGKGRFIDELEEWKKELIEKKVIKGNDFIYKQFYQSRFHNIGKINHIIIISTENSKAAQDFKYVLEEHNYDKIIDDFPYLEKYNISGIKRAIKDINEKHKECSVICILRGGGDNLDMHPFYHPIVCEAISESKIPVITAIGHVVDKPYCDHAAFVSGGFAAATPTDAAYKLILLMERQKIYNCPYNYISSNENKVTENNLDIKQSFETVISMLSDIHNDFKHYSDISHNKINEVTDLLKARNTEVRVRYMNANRLEINNISSHSCKTTYDNGKKENDEKLNYYLWIISIMVIPYVVAFLIRT